MSRSISPEEEELVARLANIREELSYIGMTACILFRPEEEEQMPWAAVVVDKENDLWSIGFGNSPESAVTSGIKGIMSLADEAEGE